MPTPKLPQLLDRKLYKTGQTRGADDDVIYQNRVARCSTVLIPYASWAQHYGSFAQKPGFENGFIILIPPETYFGERDIQKTLAEVHLQIGVNTLVFYETRVQWGRHNPQTLRWRPAKSRIAPLGGKYVARVPGTTAADDGGKIIQGFTTTSNKGAGIRVYEYASTQTIVACRKQLEFLFWSCRDSEAVARQNGMTSSDLAARRKANLDACSADHLAEYDELEIARVLNRNHVTVCPLCLEEVSASGFFSRVGQAEGREVPDLTVTELNLFHISELRVGSFNHRPYNVGWGHHHCNVVTKDSGIENTLTWMRSVLERNATSR